MFEKIVIKDFLTKPFLLKTEWMLVTAEHEGKINTMTASWGGFGVMWNKEVVYVVIRPQRYTKQFVDKSQRFTLSFFDDKYKKDLTYLGKISGKDENKLEKTGLTPIHLDEFPTFQEANLVINANVLFKQQMQPDSFLEKGTITKWYPERDFHFLYIAEIENIFKKENL